jgi:hypothetical protein
MKRTKTTLVSLIVPCALLLVWGCSDDCPKPLSPDTPSVANTIAHWKFDSAGGGTLLDDSDNGHDGVISDASWTSGPDGSTGTALAFDGAASEVNVPSSSTFSGMSQLTVEAMFKVSALPDLGEYDTLVGVYDEFLGFSAATQEAFRLSLDGMADGTRLRFAVRLDAAHVFDETEVVYTFASFPLDTWVHVAGVFDDGMFTMYLDGQLLASHEAYSTATLAAVDTPLTIGYSIGTNNANDDVETHFHGAIGEIRITGDVLEPGDFLLP